MKLAREFIRLPLSFDAERLAGEVHALPAEAWQSHPNGYKGNSAIPLISVGGEANDIFSGPMAETRWLKQSPYLRQVLASFQVVFGRSRLMGLAGGQKYPSTVTPIITGSPVYASTYPLSPIPKSCFIATTRPSTWRPARPGCSTTGKCIEW